MWWHPVREFNHVLRELKVQCCSRRSKHAPSRAGRLASLASLFRITVTRGLKFLRFRYSPASGPCVGLGLLYTAQRAGPFRKAVGLVKPERCFCCNLSVGLPIESKRCAGHIPMGASHQLCVGRRGVGCASRCHCSASTQTIHICILQKMFYPLA